MVMLPGGGVCYRGAIPIAEEMERVYHVVLVAYDGFNPDEPGTEYKSTQDEAKKLGDYVVEHCGDKDPYLKEHPEYWDENGYRRNK